MKRNLKDYQYSSHFASTGMVYLRRYKLMTHFRGEQLEANSWNAASHEPATDSDRSRSLSGAHKEDSVDGDVYSVDENSSVYKREFLGVLQGVDDVFESIERPLGDPVGLAEDESYSVKIACIKTYVARLSSKVIDLQSAAAVVELKHARVVTEKDEEITYLVSELIESKMQRAMQEAELEVLRRELRERDAAVAGLRVEVAALRGTGDRKPRLVDSLLGRLSGRGGRRETFS